LGSRSLHELPLHGEARVTTVNDLLSKALASIALESPQFDKSFEVVDHLLLAYGEHDLANRLVSEIDEATPSWPSCLRYSNGRLATTVTPFVSLPNNIALNLETYPFSNGGAMKGALQVVASKFPSTSARCKHLIESRKGA
jgi:hypothetical protein